MSSKRFKKLPVKTKDLLAESIDKLITEVKKNCTTKFDESVDLSFQINNKQKKSEINNVEKKMNFNWITKIPLQKAFIYFLILIIIFILILASIF